MTKSSEERVHFYDGRFGPVLAGSKFAQRPSRILRFFIRRQAKRGGMNLEAARLELSQNTGIPVQEIREIEEGSVPTSTQIHRLVTCLRWSILFIFGISQNAYLEAERVFFHDLQRENPTWEDRVAFRELYEEFLSVLSREAGKEQ